MDATASKPVFAASHRWDRNFFLIWIGLVWLGILVGFGSDILGHIKSHAAPYPLIVHIHALAFVGWLVLFTVQIWLIRSRKHEVHRNLGIGLICLAGVMIVLGPATAWIVERQDFTKPGGGDASFLAVQFTDILAFGSLVVAGFLLRGTSSAHKRLMLLATLYISDAGFARFLAGPLAHLLGMSFPATLVELYGAPDLLILGVGAYDLITRKRLHPAYIAGVAWIFAVQLLAVYLLLSPAWKTVAAHLIGY